MYKYLIWDLDAGEASIINRQLRVDELTDSEDNEVVIFNLLNDTRWCDGEWVKITIHE